MFLDSQSGASEYSGGPCRCCRNDNEHEIPEKVDHVRANVVSWCMVIASVHISIFAQAQCFKVKYAFEAYAYIYLSCRVGGTFLAWFILPVVLVFFLIA